MLKDAARPPAEDAGLARFLICSPSMDTTEHDLRLLSIGYYVQGGIVAFYSLLALCYVGFMGFLFTAIQNAAERDAHNQIPPGLLPLIAGILLAVVTISAASAFCLLYAGYSLRHHQYRTFLLVIAALSCLAIPYGTILGIFTFMVLQRPTARALFGEAPARPPAIPQPVSGV